MKTIEPVTNNEKEAVQGSLFPVGTSSQLTIVVLPSPCAFRVYGGAQLERRVETVVVTSPVFNENLEQVTQVEKRRSRTVELKEPWP
jgi:hypothetical protein